MPIRLRHPIHPTHPPHSKDTLMAFLRNLVNKLLGRQPKPKNDASIYPMF
ncbi:hypothetical protein [Streptomyces sp. NPDC004291]